MLINGVHIGKRIQLALTKHKLMSSKQYQLQLYGYLLYGKL